MRTIRNPEEKRVRFDGAFEATVPKEVFWQAQDEMRRRHHIPTDEEMLAPLRRLLKRRGRLTIDMITAAPDAWSHEAYANRFGNFRNVYDLVGYKPPRNLEYQDRRRRANLWLASVISLAKTLFEEVDLATKVQGETLTVDDAWRLTFFILCPSRLATGQLR
jgi:hypothetical protein